MSSDPNPSSTPKADLASQTGPAPSSNEEVLPQGRINPEKVRVVDLENTATDEIVRRDCYDPDGGPAEMGDVMCLSEDTLWLRTINWARAGDMNPEVHLQWTTIDIPLEHIGRIGVFTWPEAEAVRIFADKKENRS